MSGNPWDTEPDAVDWVTRAGLPACIRRNDLYGTLCGYLGIPLWHPWHGQAGSDVPGPWVIAFGSEEGTARFVGSPPFRPGAWWWLGTDTLHPDQVWPAHVDDPFYADMLTYARPPRGYTTIAHMRVLLEAEAFDAVNRVTPLRGELLEPADPVEVFGVYPRPFDAMGRSMPPGMVEEMVALRRKLLGLPTPLQQLVTRPPAEGEPGG